MIKLPKTLVYGAAALTAGVLFLAAPRAAHAIAATLVEVMNTRATPVPNQDVDIAARHPYTATCTIFAAGGAFATCQPTPAPPTTGFETVIQSVNMWLNQDTGTVQPIETLLGFNAGGATYQNYVPFVQQGPGVWVGSQPAAIYLDPSPINPLQCAALYNNGSATMSCTVTGYTVSLP